MWEAAQGQHKTEVERGQENKQQLDFYKLGVWWQQGTQDQMWDERGWKGGWKQEQRSWNCSTRTVLSHFCSIRNKTPFKLDWAISHSFSSPQLFQPIFPTNLAFETLQILGPHLIFSLKPRCFLVAAGCCDWVWRKTNGLQAVGLPNGTRRRPTYIRWASKTAVPTKNLTEGTMSGKYSQTAATAQEASMEVLNHVTVWRSMTLTANTTIQASSKHPFKKNRKKLHWIYTVPQLWFYCCYFGVKSCKI